ncbi:MAG TPA: hypothetical protein VKA67_10545 [Verrucomicrobiae bacterium]|nr:hypothetical protein [Verrucomicrobiae bacterium]
MAPRRDVISQYRHAEQKRDVITRPHGRADVVFSLVTFFGPAKKATRQPAGTGEVGVEFGVCDL